MEGQPGERGLGHPKDCVSRGSGSGAGYRQLLAGLIPVFHTPRTVAVPASPAAGPRTQAVDHAEGESGAH